MSRQAKLRMILTNVVLAFRLPWVVLKLRSPLGLADARRALASSVDERSSWSIFWDRHSDDLPFRGMVKHDHFEIVRQIGYGNSFVPLVCGRLREESDGTMVEITMRMHLFTSFFMGVWMVGASLGAIIFLTLSIARADPRGLLTLLLPASGAVMVGLGFGSEAVLAERLLREIFQIDKRDSSVQGKSER